MPSFEASAVLQHIRPHLWRYISGRAEWIDASPIVAELVGVTPEEVDRIAAVYIAGSTLAGDLIATVRAHLPTLRSVVAFRTAELRDTIDGTVDWGRTVQRRQTTGDPGVFVCRASRRAYESQEARMLVTALAILDRLGRQAGLGGGAAGIGQAERTEQARRLRAHPKLSASRPWGSIKTQRMRRLAFRNDACRIAAEFLQLYRDTMLERRPEQLAALVADRLLRPDRYYRLFELYVGFSIVDSLVERGYALQGLQAIDAHDAPFARLVSDSNNVVVWQQRSLARVCGLPPRNSVYRRVRVANGLTASQLRPDFLIVSDAPDRVVPVEVKLTVTEGRGQVRSGIVEALGYLMDWQPVFDAMDEPHALVVAWDANSYPASGGSIVVASQHSIGPALNAFRL